MYEVSVDGERRVLKLMPQAARARAEWEVTIGRSFDHPNLSTITDDELHEVSVDGDPFVYFTEHSLIISRRVDSGRYAVSGRCR